MINESTLVQLYQSAVAAFPGTKFRQHSTHTIRIPKLEWTTFLGVRTLFVKGLVQNEGNEYSTILLFKGVDYKINENDEEAVKIRASDGGIYKFRKLKKEGNEVIVRCSCPDFKWRWQYWNGEHGSLYGSKAKPYTPVSDRGPANPFQMEGLCKHLLKTFEALGDAGALA
jgi:hypothetical protein